METNGVYFGAEIVRDLTPAPGSRMEKKRRGERVGWGGGQAEGAFISGSHSPTFSHLHPSLPLCPSVLCLLPPLAVSLTSRPPPPPCPSLLFWAGLQAPPPRLGTQAAPGCVWKQRVLGKLGPGFPGARRGAGQALEGCQPVGRESELSTAPEPPPAVAGGSFAWVLAQLWPSEALTSELSPLQPWQRRASGPAGAPCPPQASWFSAPLSGLSLGSHSCHLSVLL